MLLKKLNPILQNPNAMKPGYIIEMMGLLPCIIKGKAPRSGVFRQQKGNRGCVFPLGYY